MSDDIKPRRIQLRRTKGWRMPPNTVKVDRTTKWGNPYRAGVHCDHQHAVDCHRYLLTLGRPARTAPYPDQPPINYVLAVTKDIGELRGKNLACWCSLEQPCHADVLLELANGAGALKPKSQVGSLIRTSSGMLGGTSGAPATSPRFDKP